MPARKALRMKASSYLISYMRTPLSFCLSFFPSISSPRMSAVIGILSAAAALSPYLFPHLPLHLFACAIGALLDRRFVCHCCLVFSPTKRDIATTTINLNIEHCHDYPRLQHLMVQYRIKLSPALSTTSCSFTLDFWCGVPTCV